MARSKVDDAALLEALLQVFRTYGYDGASLTRLSQATGLQRASLYHRFPGGKEEMAQAVLAKAGEWVQEELLGPLEGDGPPEERLQRMLTGVEAFYDGGRSSCLLDALSMGDKVENPLRPLTESALKSWIGGLTKLAKEAGVSTREARERAEDAVARIQGTLILARISGDTKPFRRTLKAIPAALLAA